VRLHWADGEPALRLTANGDTEDLLDGKTSGTGRVALAVNKLAWLLDEFAGKTVNLDVTSAVSPLLISDSDDQNFLCVLAPTAVSSRGAP
jgi:DNA polymerase III sliding clamp (beta) subunit (PCNA family)